MTCNLIEKEKFDALSNAEKRVAIAKDVILRIYNEKIIASPGSLFGDTESIADSELTIQEYFNEKPCSVCAKGALICSWIGNFNHYSKLDVIQFDMDFRSGSWLDDPSYIRYPKELLDIFGREMLDDIELAFEQELFSWHINYSEFKDDFESDWDSPYYEDIQAIMENIIANNGEFIF